MKYSKPEVELIGSALVSVQNTRQTKQLGQYTDSWDGTAFHNTHPMPAYEADE
jgi:hypothetical protein